MKCTAATMVWGDHSVEPAMALQPFMMKPWLDAMNCANPSPSSDGSVHNPVTLGSCFGTWVWIYLHTATSSGNHDVSNATHATFYFPNQDLDPDKLGEKRKPACNTRTTSPLT